MTEHLYFNTNNPFPTMARGLFTEAVEEGDPLPPGLEAEYRGSKAEERIVARGYDKFFSIDEVPWTNWDAMAEHTQGPYHITLKSNGCLILISALTPEHLMVSSKHSLGTTTEGQEPASLEDKAIGNGINAMSLSDAGANGQVAGAKVHAEEGRKWLRRTLQKSGKTEAELAGRLWAQNLTAVLELCDDSFEEHVIATPVHWTGLHLHGLNTNTASFNSLPPSEVDGFAHDFGFIPTKYATLHSISEVREYTTKISETGAWDGEVIEGFVVRCLVKSSTTSRSGQPPYSPGTPLFFKVKFEEPYKLYRAWREITRVMLPLLTADTIESKADIWKKVKRKVSRPEEAVYADWAGTAILVEPTLFDAYDKGVIRVRERFLKWTEGDGQAAWAQAKAGKYKLKGVSIEKPKADQKLERTKVGLKKKYIIVPAAIPGCGKTLVGVALAELFQSGHTQSDDVTTKKTAPTFLKNIAGLLGKVDVVYADRNNHIDKHYNELFKLGDTDKSLRNFDVRLIAVVWDVKGEPYHRTLRTCAERVIKRGNNHQTLRPDTTPEAEHEAIVGKFLRDFTEPDEELFETVLRVKVMDAPHEVLSKLVAELVPLLDLVPPSEAQVDRALRKALEYRTTTPYHAPQKLSKAPRYYALAPEIQIEDVVKAILDGSHASADHVASARAFFEHLVGQGRLAKAPHVTLVHEKTVAEEKEGSAEGSRGPVAALWDKCVEQARQMRMYEYSLTHLVWDDRVMALALAGMRAVDGKGDEVDLPSDVVEGLHITIGTRAEDIPAFESRAIVRMVRRSMAFGAGNNGEAKEVTDGGGKVRWMAVEPVLKGEGRVRGMA